MHDFMQNNPSMYAVPAQVEGLACLATLGAHVPHKGPATLDNYIIRGFVNKSVEFKADLKYWKVFTKYFLYSVLSEKELCKI